MSIVHHITNLETECTEALLEALKDNGLTEFQKAQLQGELAFREGYEEEVVDTGSEIWDTPDENLGVLVNPSLENQTGTLSHPQDDEHNVAPLVKDPRTDLEPLTGDMVGPIDPDKHDYATCPYCGNRPKAEG